MNLILEDYLQVILFIKEYEIILIPQLFENLYNSIICFIYDDWIEFLEKIFNNINFSELVINIIHKYEMDLDNIIFSEIKYEDLKNISPQFKEQLIFSHINKFNNLMIKKNTYYFD